jgi:hypothetical protein
MHSAGGCRYSAGDPDRATDRRVPGPARKWRVAGVALRRVARITLRVPRVAGMSLGSCVHEARSLVNGDCIRIEPGDSCVCAGGGRPSVLHRPSGGGVRPIARRSLEDHAQRLGETGGRAGHIQTFGRDHRKAARPVTCRLSRAQARVGRFGAPGGIGRRWVAAGGALRGRGVRVDDTHDPPGVVSCMLSPVVPCLPRTDDPFEIDPAGRGTRPWVGAPGARGSGHPAIDTGRINRKHESAN